MGNGLEGGARLGIGQKGPRLLVSPSLPFWWLVKRLTCYGRLVLLDNRILGNVGILHLLGPTRQPSPGNTSRGLAKYKRVKQPK